MRKILCISFILVLLFSSCGKESETSKLPSNNLTESYSENNQNSAPMVVYATLTDLKEIKSAFDSMQPDEFMDYMENEKFNQYITGMWDYENSKALFDELCATTIPLLDGDEKNFSEIGFYWKNNSIHQLIFFDDVQRVSALIDTVKSTQPKELQLGDDVNFISVKPIDNDNYTAQIYEVENADYSFFADIITDDTYIVLRSHDIQTIEDFESCFARLEFVKIGDLLKEVSIEATQPENNSETTLTTEETTQESTEITEVIETAA